MPSPVASPNSLTPVLPEERIVVLDVLRGLALLGILTVNLPGAASSGYAWAAGLDPFPAWWDKAAEWIVNPRIGIVSALRNQPWSRLRPTRCRRAGAGGTTARR